jgi:signal transduction histidine kinase/BarA-like signal transduction histidine kinase
MALTARNHLFAELTTHREELEAQNEELRNRERELWQARVDLNDLYELAPIPYVTLTSFAEVAAVNVSAARFLEQPAPKLIGKPFALLVARTDRPRFRQHIAACCRSHKIASIEVSLDLPSGVAVAQISSSLTQTGWIYMAIIDLRERQRAEIERRDHAVNAEAARAAMKLKDDFLATLSHELRTPLTPVMIAIDTLERVCSQAGVATDDLFDIIHRNLHQEVRLINDLLDVTRLTNGKLAMKKQTVDLHQPIREAMNQVRSAAEKKRVALAADFQAERSHIHGDSDRLRQVFANLLHNGIKFTPAGGTITVASSSRQNQVLIEVRDSGVGIPREDRERIFARFVQGTNGHDREGMGLGLAIARDIVQAHGGTINARSAGPGKGATFDVTLDALRGVRASRGEGGARPAVQARRPRPAPAPSGSGKRILFVEDHLDAARLTTAVLEGAGHQVAVAHTVAAALAHADEPFDLVVSDIDLPDGTGIELMKQLRAKRPIAGIALSGFGAREDIKRSRAAGFQRYLVKPVTMPELLQAIQDVR